MFSRFPVDFFFGGGGGVDLGERKWGKGMGRVEGRETAVVGL